jgi:hypothetical protein
VDIDVVTKDKLHTLLERAWIDRIKNRDTLKRSVKKWRENLEAKIAMLPNYYTLHNNRSSP